MLSFCTALSTLLLDNLAVRMCLEHVRPMLGDVSERSRKSVAEVTWGLQGIARYNKQFTRPEPRSDEQLSRTCAIEAYQADSA